MRKGWLLVIFGILAAGVAVHCLGQDTAKAINTSTGKKTCECGAHPPGPPRDREVALMRENLRTCDRMLSSGHPTIPTTRAPISIWVRQEVSPIQGSHRGANGFFGPIEDNSESVLGQRMLHGAQLAVEEANANGGYGGRPFKLMLHNDYNNWQAKAVYAMSAHRCCDLGLGLG